jgi:hypothetical protein
MTTAAAAFALLAAPTAANAATYTVAAGNGPCGGADLACGSLVEAGAAAAQGDVFNVAPGTYAATEFTVGGVTINGAPGVAIDGTLTFSSNSGPPSVLSKVALSQSTNNAPGIFVSGAAGLQVLDAAIVSFNGEGIILNGGVNNAIIRTLVVSGGAVTSAVKIDSNGVTPTTGPLAKGLLIESSILTGANSLTATTEATALDPTPGDITIVGHHITTPNGVVIDASNANPPLLGSARGNITASLTDSIALNSPTPKRNAFITPNIATLDTVRTLTTTDPATIFADPGHKNYRLRPDAKAAIDVGGFTPGESATDIDGDPRPGPTTDLGADEFFNAPPVASLVVKGTARAGQPVLLDGTASSDREGNFGGGIVAYRWDFGDGSTEVTATPTVLHTYAGEGAAGAQLVVVDRQGGVSKPAVARVDVGDGVAPEVTITKPFAGQRIHLTTVTKKTTTAKNGKKKTTTTKKQTKLSFGGAAKDKSGVAFVLLTIEKIGADTSSKTSAKASQSKAAKAQCTWFDAKKGLLKISCSKPKLLVAKLLKDGSWTFTPSSKTKRLSAGLYRVSVYGADGSGAFGNSAPSKDGVIRFRLVK